MQNITENKLHEYIKQKRWNEALDRCKTRPNEIRLKDKLGDLPLHDACRNRAPLNIIQALYQAYPKGTTATNDYGKLPIHNACKKDASLEVIKFLHQVNPKGVATPNTFGHLPIHDACLKGASLEIIQFLHNSYQFGVKIQDKNGYLPLHHACKLGASMDIIKFLHDSYPASKDIKTKSGETPLAIILNSKKTKGMAHEDMIDILGTPDEPDVKQQPNIEQPFQLERNMTFDDSFGNSNSPCQHRVRINDLLPHLDDGHGYLSNQMLRPKKPIDDVKATRSGNLMHPIPMEKVEHNMEPALEWSSPRESPISRSLPTMFRQKIPIDDVKVSRSANLISPMPMETVEHTMELSLEFPSPRVHFDPHSSPQSMYRPNKSTDDVKATRPANLMNSKPMATVEHTTEPTLECLNSREIVGKRFLPKRMFKPKKPNDDAKVTRSADFMSSKPMESVEHTTEPTLEYPDSRENPKSCSLPSSMFKPKSTEDVKLTRSENFRSTLMEKAHSMEPFYLRTTVVQADPYLSDREKIRKAYTDENAPPQELSKEYINMCTTKQKLGDGAFGEVFLGVDGELASRFAIKSLRYEILEGGKKQLERARKTMDNELKTLNNFQHPHIARLCGYYLSDDLRGEQFLVYELASRGSLDKFLESSQKRSDLNWQRRILIALEIASALTYLHEGGDAKHYRCFHRDVKSANVCLKVDYSAVLVDCGLAKLQPMDDSDCAGLSLSTTKDRLMGTLQYMCPVYARLGIFDDKSEVFSFAIVMFELLTGSLQKQYPDSFYDKYVDNTMGGAGDPHSLMHDIDHDAGTWNDVALQKFSTMAMNGIMANPQDRPSMRAVFNLLEELAKEFCYSNRVVECQSRDMNNPSYEYFIKLLEGIYDRVAVMDSNIQNIQKGVNSANIKLDNLQYKMHQMSAALTSVAKTVAMPCPRLGVLIPPTDGKKRSNFNVKDWFSKKMDLYFLCALDFTPVEPPIKIRVSKEWLKAAAPYLKIGLFLLKSIAIAGAGAAVVAGIPCLAGNYIDSMNGCLVDLMGELNFEAVECLCELMTEDVEASHDRNRQRTISALTGKEISDEAYKAITKVATNSENKAWEKSMELVSFGDDRIVWIKKENRAKWNKIERNGIS